MALRYNAQRIVNQYSPQALDFARRSQADWDRYALARFVPSPVLRSAMADPWPRQVWRLPNRLGKTRHACAKGAQAMVSNPGSRWRFVGPNRLQTQHVMGRYLSQFLGPYLHPASYYVDGKGWNTLTIRLANGSIGQLRSYEDRPDTHAGDELDGVILDEPPPRSIFTENVARTMSREGSQVILTLTPVGRPVGWLKDMVNADNSPWKETHAVFNRQNAPWYSEAQVEEWMETMRASPWDWAQRVEGAWEGLEVERMFSGWTDASIVDVQPSGSLKVGVFFDHGESVGHETALLLAWKETKKRTQIWCIDTYVNDAHTSPEEDAHAVLEMLALNGIRPHKVDLAVGDINSAGKGYAGWSINQVIEQAMAEELGRRTTPFRIQVPDKTPGTVEWGLRCINVALKRGDLKVHSRCKPVIETLSGWRGSKKQDEDGKLSHVADALRYGVMAILTGDEAYARLRFA